MPNQILEDHSIYTLPLDDGDSVDLQAVGRVIMNDITYVLLQDSEDEEALLVFRVEEEDGEEFLTYVEDESESETVFYYFEACSEDYEFEDAR